MARVAIIGLGNIGTVFAAHLIHGGRHDVTACVRRAVAQITVETPTDSITVPVVYATDADRVDSVDWVLLATKTQDTDGAAPWLERLGGRVLVLQNGLDQAERLGAAHCVVPTVIYTNAKRLAPTHVRHMRPDFDLAVPDTPDGHDAIELFSGTDIRVQPVADFVTAAWRKFLINLAANPITALTGKGIAVFRQPEMERLARQLFQESAAIARAEGAKLESDVGDVILKWLTGFPGDVGTSMLEDRLAGRPLEQETITGYAVQLGRKHNLPTPINEFLLALLRASAPVTGSRSPR